MTRQVERQTSTPHRSGAPASAPAASPGKRTLTQALGAPLVQRLATEAAAPDGAAVHAAAARGVASTSGALPFADRIQQLFGRHDISSIRAHTGPAAGASAQAMGAAAYATGDHVVLGGAHDLRTVAHEAAHVVQQRGGVQLAAGVGEVGDAHERHADEVADLVVRGESAEHLLDRYAPGGSRGGGAGGGAVQHMPLTRDAATGQLRKPKKSEKTATLDTSKMPLEALNAVLVEIAKYAPKLAEEIRAERPATKPTGDQLTDIAHVFTIAAELEALEAAKAKEPKAPIDAPALKRIAAKLSAAHELLHSVEIPGEATLYRDTIAAYTRRLNALDDKIKLSYKGGGGDGPALDLAISPADRQAYRDDVNTDGVWGGLGEADVAARRINRRISIFRIDRNNIYHRVTTVGAGALSTHHLLHLGNHYVAINATVADGAAVTAMDGRIETEEDGNCMYEAIQICLLHRKPTNLERTGFLTAIRAHVSQQMTDAAIDTSIIAVLAQGERSGLGAKMRGMVTDRTATARIEQLDDDELAKITERYKSLKPSKQLDHTARAATYLEERRKAKASKATAEALAALEASLAKADMALASRDLAIDPTQIELPVEWFAAVRGALGEAATKDEVFAPLLARVVEFNRKAKSSEHPIDKRLGELDGLEHAFHDLEAPGGPLDGKDAAHERARVAVYGFQTVELRKVRANLVRLYQLSEGSPYRTFQPGNRPDMHYDVYAHGEKPNKGQRTTPELGGLSKKEATLVNDEMAPGSEKAKQEALSAVALSRTYPALFSGITKAPTYTGISHNVEYYDNLGNPWDQVAGHSYTKGADAAAAIVGAVIDHLNNKPYPAKGTKDAAAAGAKKLPCGVVLDCSYLDHNDYVRMWALMIQRVPSDVLRSRVVEVNVPFGKEDHKPAYAQSKGEGASNTTVLDSCRPGKIEGEEAGRIYPVSRALLGKHMPSLGTDASAIRKGTSSKGNKDHPVYRNHGGFLPNTGSYFLEYHVTNCGSLPDHTDVRIVYDQPNQIFYVTGTHYRPFMSPYGNVMRNPFYRVVD